MVKPGATLIDVGINRITTREEFDRFFKGDAKREATFAKRGSTIVGDIHPKAVRDLRRLHAGSRRRGPAHHRHADGQHRARRQDDAARALVMLRVGLTGGLGSGKSTVAAMLRELGAQVIEADALGRALMEPGQPSTPKSSAPSARRSSAPMAASTAPASPSSPFSEGRLQRLNAIVHPAVIAAQQQLDGASVFARDPAAVAVVESALIFEVVRDARARGEQESILADWRQPHRPHHRGHRARRAQNCPLCRAALSPPSATDA